MRRRIFSGAALAAVLAALAVSGTASAGHSGGCPNNGFERVSASLDPIADKNGDGWICTKAISLGNDKGAFSDVDNNAQGSNLP